MGKTVKQQYLLHMSSQYGELRPTIAKIGSGVWGTSANFNEFRVLASLLAHRRPTKLCTMFGRLLGYYNIYIFGGYRPRTEFRQVFSYRPIGCFPAVMWIMWVKVCEMFVILTSIS